MLWTIQILNKKTRKPTNYIVDTTDHICEYIFEDGVDIFKTATIGDAMRKCIEIMRYYPDYLAKVFRIEK